MANKDKGQWRTRDDKRGRGGTCEASILPRGHQTYCKTRRTQVVLAPVSHVALHHIHLVVGARPLEEAHDALQGLPGALHQVVEDDVLDATKYLHRGVDTELEQHKRFAFDGLG